MKVESTSSVKMKKNPYFTRIMRLKNAVLYKYYKVLPILNNKFENCSTQFENISHEEKEPRLKQNPTPTKNEKN